MMAIDSKTSPPKMASSEPASQVPSGDLNCWIWLPPMTIASPFTNPKITGCGTRRINLPSLSSPAATCIRPARTTVAKMYSGPWDNASDAMTTATAPVAPLIMPGRPPSTLATSPTMNAAYKPVKGLSPAMSAKATASGIRAMATVKPLRISLR